MHETNHIGLLDNKKLVEKVLTLKLALQCVGAIHPAVTIHHLAVLTVPRAQYRLTKELLGSHQHTEYEQHEHCCLVMKPEHIVVNTNLVKL